MKEIFKKSASLFLKLIIVNFMCAIIVLSFNVLASGLFSKEIGYTAFGTIENAEGKEESKELYTYYFKDGEDAERAKYEADGYKITEYPLKELPKKTENIAAVVSQVFCFLLLATFIYPIVWDVGIKDGNLVKFKHKEVDILKGLKIGLLTISPSVLLLVFLFVAQGITKNVPLALYKLINSSFYGFIDLIDGKATNFGNLTVLSFILLLVLQLIIPIITHISYILGYKNISIGEKLVFKKNK